MKKRLKSIALIIGFVSIIAMLYNFTAYVFLKGILISSNETLPPIVDSLTAGLLISFLFMCLYHLMLLFHTFYFLPQMTKNLFLGSIYFVGLILSGLLIASNGTLLMDLGKEYLMFDVSHEWNMLFFTSSVQLVIMIIGFFLILKNEEESPFTFFPKAKKFDESMFIIVNQIGLLCGLLALIILVIPDLMGINDYYKSMWMTVLTILVLLPFLSSIIYWLLRNRGKQLSEILDEKQFQDLSFSGLIAVIFIVIILFAELLLSRSGIINLNNPIFTILSIDFIIIILSSTVLIRSRN